MLKVIELFGGIGSPRKALERLKIGFKVVDYVEIDKFAVKSYNAMYGENYEPQDICNWNKDIEADMVVHGSPCQDFSIAGKQAGGDKDSGTRSSLIYETIRIVKKIRPKYVIWENVPNVLSAKHRHNFDKYLEQMEELGYTNYYEKLNAKDYGIPQNRLRVFTISILGEHKPFIFPSKQELKLRLKDMLEDEVDEKYYLSNEIINKLQSYNFDSSKRINNLNGVSNTLTNMQGGHREPKVYVANKYKEFIRKNGYIPEMFNPYNKAEIEDVAPTQTTNCGGTASSATVLKRDDLRIRKLTPLEVWRLMGFDDEDFYKAQGIGNSNSQLYKQARK